MDYLLDIGALISGFWLLWYGFSVWRMKSLMENIAGSKLGSVAMGYAEVCGEARGDYPLKSPITLAPCVY
ncbi:MAG: hypothetical protein HGA78_10975, partial [Nitrospirales bacterium]|nr:hypothetical protein [Nitrospirales bacterium]